MRSRETSRLPWRIALALILFATTAQFAGELHFKRHVINQETDYSAAALMDVNRDGKIDIVCGGNWYEGPSWKKHFLAKIPRIGGRPDGYAHLPFDVNRDGWTDLITVNYRSGSIKWMEHPGEQLGVWTTHVAVEPGPMETGRLVDIDLDGNLDLLPNGAKFAAWWEFRWKGEGTGHPAWIRHDLPREAGGHGLGSGDINGDGRKDIVGQYGWLEAPKDARHGQWKWHDDFRLERASIPMLVVDPDEDGDADIVWCSAHGFGVFWLEHSIDDKGEHHWERHAIDTSWSQGHAPLWHDMDGDGRAELITGKRYMAHGGKDPGEYDPLGIFRYEFEPDTRTWQRTVISPFGQRVGVGLDPKIADIDGDGDPDFLASGRSGIYWLENLGAARMPTASSPREIPEYDHQELFVVGTNNGMKPVNGPEDWGIRRSHIVSAMEKAHGKLPLPSERVPLDLRINDSAKSGSFRSQQVEYRVDTDRSMAASILIPNAAEQGQSIGLVCMFDKSSRVPVEQIAQELTSLGFVCIVLDRDSVNELPKQGNTLVDGVWQAMRAADVLQASEFVHGEKIGFVGNAFQGQLGLYVAAIDQRFIATVCDLEGANALTAFDQSQYSLAELLASAAPRSLILLKTKSPELASKISPQVDIAKPVFELRQAAAQLSTLSATIHADAAARFFIWKTLKSRFRPQFQFRIPKQ